MKTLLYSTPVLALVALVVLLPTSRVVVGQRHQPPQRRRLIAGGTFPSIGKYPWFATSTGDQYCGATLVHTDLLVTAAHCDKAFVPGKNITLRAYFRNDNRFGGAIRRIVSSVLVQHPNYNATTLNYDFMLIKLTVPVPLSLVTPIPLNTDGAVPADGQVLTTMGFGALSTNGTYLPLRLREVQVAAVPSATCIQQYQNVNGLDSTTRKIVDPTVEVCAGAAPQKGHCFGDSGAWGDIYICLFVCLFLFV
jgi:trypsin